MNRELCSCREFCRRFGGRGTLRNLVLGFLMSAASVGFLRAAAPTGETETEHPSAERERVCLSMKVLTSEAGKEPIPGDAENLAGIGWLEGFVTDTDNGDVILIGRRTPRWPSLHIDDLAANIRNVWNDDVHPYCSLDPRAEDVRKLTQIGSRAGAAGSFDEMHKLFSEIKAAWGPQSVVVGGVPRNSRHAHVMIYADYHMKKVSQGLVRVGGIRSCLDIVLDEAKRQLDQTGRPPGLGMSISRFWFHVREGEPRYRESKGIVYLDRCSVVVLTEKQRSTADGVLHDSIEDDPYASAFAQEFSDRFQKAATLVPEYADLENLFRLSAVLRAMHFRGAASDAGLDLGFWLKRYAYKRETGMPPSLPGLANSREARGEFTRGDSSYGYVLFPMVCGGVSMEIDVDEHRFAATHGEQLRQLHDSVIQSRPSPAALSWTLPSTLK
jgi:hypothetical protein